MVNSTKKSKKRRPATTPEARESQLVSLAVGLAEQQLQDGTASSQVITHFLKLGASDREIEKEMLISKNELLKAKTDLIRSEKRVESLYMEALEAMKSYKGVESDNNDNEDSY